MNELVRDVCMSHQSDWRYYKQPIKLPLVKVNHVCGERPSLFFLQTEAGLYWDGEGVFVRDDISQAPINIICSSGKK